MAKISEIDETMLEEWLQDRPPIIRELCNKLPPNLLYRMKSSGHRCTIFSYSEDGTVTVAVTGEFNRVKFGRRVFGILRHVLRPLDDLEECELPLPGEPLGEELQTEEEILAYVNEVRAEKGLNNLDSVGDNKACPCCHNEERKGGEQ